jgi:antibiotic biosynthesis monooxygenase (ABM) superfamily enzyme
MKRLVVGWIALYPTLPVILFLLGGITRHLSMPLATLVEVIVFVPVTQLIAYPISGKSRSDETKCQFCINTIMRPNSRRS